MRLVREDVQGTQEVTSNRDVIIEADRDQDGVGDFIVVTGGVERCRIKFDGSVSGVLAGGATTLSAILAANNDAGAHKIANLIDPVSAQDAATKNYVDTAIGTLPSSTVAGTTYTFAATDKGTAILHTSATAVTDTVPPNSTVALPVGAQIMVYQGGAGTVTIAPGAGVTLHSPGGNPSTAAQYSTLVLWQVAANVWVVGGELASTAIDDSILTTKGDLIVATGAGAPSRVGVGADGTALYADSTKPAGVGYQRPKDIEELQAQALGLASYNYPPSAVVALSSPTSQSAYLLRVGLRKGMAITGLQFTLGVAAVGAAPTGIFVGLADTNGVALVQSGNTNGTLWTSTGFLNIPFGSTYTVPADGSYYAFLLVNGTWATTQPTIGRLGGTMIDDIRWDARQGGLTTPPANAASFTPVATAILHFWVGCVGS